MSQALQNLLAAIGEFFGAFTGMVGEIVLLALEVGLLLAIIALPIFGIWWLWRRRQRGAHTGQSGSDSSS